MVTRRLGIVADDFTGACDTAVAFVRPGQTVAVALPGAALPQAAVVALDTASRHLVPADAQTAVRGALTRLTADGVRLAYKKVDSTLRGQPGIELAALQAPGRPALFCPAFPALGRTVVDGRLLVHGRPLNETEFGGEATVATCLAPWAPGPVQHIPLATVRSPAALAAAVAALAGNWAVLDAETDADLDAIAAAGLALDPASPATAGSALPPLPLFAGGGGLAAALARRWFGGATPQAPALPGPGLLLVGSRHPAAAAQVAAAEAAGALLLRLPALAEAEKKAQLAWALGPRAASQRPMEVLGPLARAAAEALAAGRPVVVQPPAVELPPGAVQRRFGALAYAVLALRRPAWLFATGGETARSVCHALGAHVVELAGERFPGVVQGRLADGPHAGLALIAKAGGFGGPDLLVQLMG